jgi:hypothetical protein
MHHADWIKAKREDIRKAVANCFDTRGSGGWHENIITREVLQTLGVEQSVDWAEKPFRSEWKIFKATGRYETANGDIAMKVVLRTNNGEYVIGTKFFEAKKIGLQSLRYDAIDRAQLERMQYLGGHEVLFYSLTQEAPNTAVFGQALCVPTPMALMLLGSGTSALHRASISFIDCFAHALSGRGLNWSSSQARHFDQISMGVDHAPSFVLTAHIAPADLELEPISAPMDYEPLEEPDQSRELSP